LFANIQQELAGRIEISELGDRVNNTSQETVVRPGKTQSLRELDRNTGEISEAIEQHLLGLGVVALFELDPAECDASGMSGNCGTLDPHRNRKRTGP